MNRLLGEDFCFEGWGRQSDSGQIVYSVGERDMKDAVIENAISGQSG